MCLHCIRVFLVYLQSFAHHRHDLSSSFPSFALSSFRSRVTLMQSLCLQSLVHCHLDSSSRRPSFTFLSHDRAVILVPSRVRRFRAAVLLFLHSSSSFVTIFLCPCCPCSRGAPNAVLFLRTFSRSSWRLYEIFIAFINQSRTVKGMFSCRAHSGRAHIAVLV